MIAPPFSSKRPALTVSAPASVKEPLPATVAVACAAVNVSEFAVTLVEIVTTPESITASSPAPGATPSTQSEPWVQSPLTPACQWIVTIAFPRGFESDTYTTRQARAHPY